MGLIDWSQNWHRYTVEIPIPLMPLLEERRKSVPYPSVSKYFFWMFIYDLTADKPHRFTPDLMRKTAKRQHEYFELLIAGKHKAPGGWMDTFIRNEAIAAIQRGDVDDAVRERAEKLAKLDAIKRRENQGRLRFGDKGI